MRLIIEPDADLHRTLRELLEPLFGQVVEASDGRDAVRRFHQTDPGLIIVVDGLTDKNPRVRWWCVQVLDHVRFACRRSNREPPRRPGTASASLRRTCARVCGLQARVERRPGPLVTENLIGSAAQDPNMKVRSEAAHALACTT
jgi:hypothetical protein